MHGPSYSLTCFCSSDISTLLASSFASAHCAMNYSLFAGQLAQIANFNYWNKPA